MFLYFYKTIVLLDKLGSTLLLRCCFWLDSSTLRYDYFYIVLILFNMLSIFFYDAVGDWTDEFSSIDFLIKREELLIPDLKSGFGVLYSFSAVSGS